MSAVREAIVLPLAFLAVAFLGGFEPGARIAFLPPPLFSLVLALMLMAALVKSGSLAPDRVVRASRAPLANTNGVVLLLTLFAASAQVFSLLTPRSGLPLLLFNAFLFVLLLNTLVAAPDRVRLLRSLLVILGAAFVLKFVVLAALSDPEGGRLKRVLVLLLEGVTLGNLVQQPLRPAAGYVGFFTLLIYLAAVAALPAASPRTRLPGERVPQLHD